MHLSLPDMAPKASRVASWFRGSSKLTGGGGAWNDDTIAEQFDAPLLSEEEKKAEDTAPAEVDIPYTSAPGVPAAPPAAPPQNEKQGKMFTVTLARNESGLGLVFSADFVITKLLPGCAAEQHGGLRIGDMLIAVDGIELHPGDKVGALFPIHVQSFELRLLRGGMPASPLDAGLAKPKPRHTQRRIVREPSGKFEPLRPATVFQEVVWNEYCVLFPDGSSAPFNEAVRYTALTGYLRKQAVMTDGRAEWAIQHGASHRSWSRHFMHLSMKQLAWFDEDPQLAMERQRAQSAPQTPKSSATTFLRASSVNTESSVSWRRYGEERFFPARQGQRVRRIVQGRALKRQGAQGCSKVSRYLVPRLVAYLTRRKCASLASQGVGSALLYAAPCRLYVSRLHRNEFAISFGGNSLLVLQAATGPDAQGWIVAIAACLYFSSAAFEAVLAECRRFFDATHKTIQGRLSTIEALDLVRAMGRDIRYSQVVAAAKEVASEGGWFGIREFTYLVRTVCAEADPRSELLRAFRLLGTTGSVSRKSNAAESASDEAEEYIGVDEMLATMRAAGVPDSHVLMVIRAAGGDLGEKRVPFTKLADALYPAAATAAKRRRATETQGVSRDEQHRELRARAAWTAQRDEILANASATGTDVEGGAPSGLVAVRAGAPATDSGGKPAPTVYAPPGTARTLQFAPSPDATPTVPPLYGLRAATSAATALDASALTPRRQEIMRSMTESSMSVPATPRTIADRVLRARRATEISKTKATQQLSKRLMSPAVASPQAGSPEVERAPTAAPPSP